MSLLRYTPPFLFWSAGGAILVSNYGPLAILNPFRHLLAMVAAVEYVVALMLDPQATTQLFPIAATQSLNTVAGFFGLAGWLALMIAIFARYGAGDI